MSTSSNTTEGFGPRPPGMNVAETFKAGSRNRRPTHPGAVVRSSLEELKLNPHSAAPLIGVTSMALGNLCRELAAVSPEMALRLGKFFGNGEQLWINMQRDVDLWDAKQKLGDKLAKIKTYPRP